MVKAIGLLVVAVIALSLFTAALAPLTSASSTTNTPSSTTGNGIDKLLSENITYDKALQIAYLVRNESMPVLNWALGYNVTLAKAIIERGNALLSEAERIASTNQTLAKHLAIRASLVFGLSPATAYIVLQKTINSNLGDNRTVTNKTVIAVLKLIDEFKNIVGKAAKIAENNSIVLPPELRINAIIANGQAETALKLLKNGFIKAALAESIKAYNTLVKSYGLIIVSSVAQKLGFQHPVDLLTLIRRMEINPVVIKKVISHLPPVVRERIIAMIKERRVTEIRIAIHREARIVAEKINHASLDTIAKIATSVVIMASGYPGTAKAVMKWREQNNLMNPVKLYEHVKNITYKLNNVTGATGIKLLDLVLTTISHEINKATGSHVDLVKMFRTTIVMHVLMQHHRGR